MQVSSNLNSIFTGEKNGVISQYNLFLGNFNRQFTDHPLNSIYSLGFYENLVLANDKDDVIAVDLETSVICKCNREKEYTKSFALLIYEKIHYEAHQTIIKKSRILY